MVCVVGFFHEKKLEKSFLYGYAYFRQQIDSSNKRGYLQKSIVILSKFPFVKLFFAVARVMGENFFNDYDLGKKYDFAIPMKAINEWDEIQLNHKFNCKMYNKTFVYQTPAFLPQKIHFKSRSKNKEGIKYKQRLLDRLSGKRCPFQHEVNIYGCFENHIEYLFKCWELVLIGEPLLIKCTSPKLCSSSVISAISLISPIVYSGDFRPYFTVHNSDFETFSKRGQSIPHKATILGITNPYFMKCFEKWPHLLSLGSEIGKKKTNKKSKSPVVGLTSLLFNTGGREKSNEFRKSLLWEHNEVFWSKREFVVKCDPSLKKNLLHLKRTDKDKNSSVSSNNAQIRAYFDDLTEKFLDPLHKCFDALWNLPRIFLNKEKQRRVFTRDKFLTYVLKWGYRKQIFSANPIQVMDFYKKFINSVNFYSWLHKRLQDAYYNDLMHTSPKELVKNYKSQERTDLFLRLLDEYRTQKDHGLKEKIRHLAIGILASLSYTLQESLKRRADGILDFGSKKEEKKKEARKILKKELLLADVLATMKKPKDNNVDESIEESLSDLESGIENDNDDLTNDLKEKEKNDKSLHLFST